MPDASAGGFRRPDTPVGQDTKAHVVQYGL